MGNHNINVDGINYSLVGHAQVDKKDGEKKVELKQVEGRTYQLIQVTNNIKVPRVILAILALVPTVFLALGGQFSTIGNMWKAVMTGKRVTHLAVDLAKEGKVTNAALKQGLIPKLTDYEHDNYVWAKKMFLMDKIPELVQGGRLDNEIRARQGEIQAQKKIFQAKLVYDGGKAETRETVIRTNQNGQLKPLVGGQGGAYLLTEGGVPRFIVKPNDEDILSLNNRKGFANPVVDVEARVRIDIPTYESVQNEALASDIAGIIGLRPVAPETVMVVLKNDSFHLITDGLDNAHKLELEDKEGREKLCSAQEFVPNSEDLSTFTNRATANNVSFTFDQQDFEMANMFSWITEDQDGHSGNYRVYDKGEENGVKKLGIKKIDNGLICGDQDPPGTGMLNGLVIYDKQMKVPVSANGQQLINNIDLNAIVARMKFYNKSEKSIANMEKRVNLLKQEVAQNPNITLDELDNKILKSYGK